MREKAEKPLWFGEEFSEGDSETRYFLIELLVISTWYAVGYDPDLDGIWVVRISGLGMED